MNRSDRSIRILLATIAFLLAGNLAVQFHQPRIAEAQQRGDAGGGIPDSGAQLKAQIDQLIELNKKIGSLQSYLESGKLTVKMAEKTEK